MKARLKRWLAGSFRPKTHGPWESLAARALFAALTIYHFPTLMPFTTQPVPNGIARWFDLTWLAAPGALETVRWIFMGLMVPYVLGWALWAVLPLAAFLHIAIFSLNNSQGYINHNWQIVSSILLIQTFVAWWWPLRQAWRARSTPTAERDVHDPALTRDAWLWYFTQLIMALFYTTSAVSKVKKSGLGWMMDLENLSLAVKKTSVQAYYSDPSVGSAGAMPAAGQWIMDHPLGTAILFGPALPLEFFAFVALWNRAVAFWLGLALIAMHCGIEAIMALDFYINSLCLLIFYVNLPGWIAAWLNRRRATASAKN